MLPACSPQPPVVLITLHVDVPSTSWRGACTGRACRPYFLPCLVAGILSAVATVMTLGWLDETLPSRRRQAGAVGGGTAADSSAARYQQVPATEEHGAPGLAGSGGGGGGGDVELGGLAPLSPASSIDWQGDGSSGASGKGRQGLSSSRVGGKGEEVRLRAFRGDSARMSVSGSGKVDPTEGQLGRGAGGGGAWGSMRPGRSGSSVSPLSSLESMGSDDEEELELGLGGATAKERAALLDSPSSLAAGGAAEPPVAPDTVAVPDALLPWHKLKAVRLSLCGYGERAQRVPALITARPPGTPAWRPIPQHCGCLTAASACARGLQV